MRRTDYVLGLDAGGTKTVCAIVDREGNLIGYGRGGPTNINFVDAETAAQSARTAVLEAIFPITKGANGEKPIFVTACVAGPVPGEVARATLEELASPSRVHFTGEPQVALASGSIAEWGMVILSGTGSFVWLRSADGRGHTAGGWGATLGDEGSAYWIGLEGLKSCVRGYDGRGPKTSLVVAILRYLGLERIHQIVHEVYQGNLRQRAKVAELSRVVADVASSGDEVSIAILRRAAEELVLGAEACVHALGMEQERFDCVLSGGVFSAGDLIIAPLVDMLHERFPGIRIASIGVDQVVGCCAIALREAGAKVDEPLLGRLQRGIAEERKRYLAMAKGGLM